MRQNKKSLPVIGIVPALDLAVKLPQSQATHYLRREYTELLASIGAVPLIVNIDMPLGYILEQCDGIVISGGEDLDPTLYAEEPMVVQGALREPRIRADWEYDLLAACDERQMPVLGICYGMQLLNVYYGGTLYQDISQEVPDAIGHFLTTHDVTFATDFLGYQADETMPTASRHHQAVDELGEGVKPAAHAPDGIVEAITVGRHYGMQWHPESDITGVRVYRTFIEACTT